MRRVLAMDERTQGAMLLAVGGVALRLGLTDAALNYVKVGLQPLLTISGAVLVALGLVAVVRAFREPAPDDPGLDHAAVGADGHALAVDDGHGHGGHGPAVAWLLLLPLLALLLVAPPPLGAFAAARQSTLAPVDTTVDYPPLPAPEDGAVPLQMSEFVYRALYDEEESLAGQTVRLTGFVTPSPDGDDYQLSRFTLNCCAADARAITVAVADDATAPPPDTWLELEGTWEPRPGARPGETATTTPLLRVTDRTEIPPPDQPYEY